MAARQQKTFGATLREMRLAKNVSLRKFAEKVGVSPTYLSQVEQDNCAGAGPSHGRPESLLGVGGKVGGQLPRPPVFRPRPDVLSARFMSGFDCGRDGC